MQHLMNLFREENRIFAESLQVAHGDRAMTEMLNAIDFALDFMLEAAGIEQGTDDGRAISATAGRIFNTSAASLRLAVSGYYQMSFALMRDLIEIQTLLDYFIVDRSQIARWRAVTNDERLREFKPSRLRQRLAEVEPATADRRRRTTKPFLNTQRT